MFAQAPTFRGSEALTHATVEHRAIRKTLRAIGPFLSIIFEVRRFTATNNNSPNARFAQLGNCALASLFAINLKLIIELELFRTLLPRKNQT